MSLNFLLLYSRRYLLPYLIILLTIIKHNESHITFTHRVRNKNIFSNTGFSTVNVTQIITISNLNGTIQKLLPIKNDYLVAGSDSNQIFVFNLKQNCTLKNEIAEHTGAIISLGKLVNGMLVSGSNDSALKFWNATGDFSMVQSLTNDAPVSYTLQLNNGLFATADWNKNIKIWNPIDYKSFTITSAHTDKITEMIQLRNSMVASAAASSDIKVWDPNDRFNNVKTLNGHSSSVNTLELLENGLLVSGSTDGTIRVWNATGDFNIIHILDIGDNHISQKKVVITDMSYLDGGVLVCSGDDGVIRIFNTTDNFMLIGNFTAHETGINSLVRIGKSLVATASANNIKLWNFTYSYIENEEEGSGNFGFILIVLLIIIATIIFGYLIYFVLEKKASRFSKTNPLLR